MQKGREQMENKVSKYIVEWIDIEFGKEVVKTQFVRMCEGCTAQDAANVVAKLNGKDNIECIVTCAVEKPAIGYVLEYCGKYVGHGVDERKQNMMRKWLGGENK